MLKFLQGKMERAAYKRRTKEEIEHYSGIFRNPPAPSHVGQDHLFQPVPPCWVELELRASHLIRQSTGHNLEEHVTTQLSESGGRMLSLGCGPGGIELAFARAVPKAEITAIDFNPDLLELGRQRATQENLNVVFQQADLNTVKLPKRAYDLVFCHASLHHVIELEHLAREIKLCLCDGGELVIVDVITPNGYQMWPETREVARNLWNALPSRFRINHTAYRQPKVDDTIWEGDTSHSGMECIRSEEILRVLEEEFVCRHFVPYYSLSRRFLDTMYGPNYDLSRSLDSALFEWIWQLDLFYLQSNTLRPETFFGVYSPR